MAMGSGNDSTSFIDLMVSSQTGSGKTAAFLLPVLHTLIQQQAAAEAEERAAFERAVAEAAARGEPAPKRAKRKDPTNSRNFKAATPGALILCPTRELAQQVAHDAIDLVKHCRGLRVANVVGGMPYQLQIAKLQNANLVVATPGRLLDLQRSMQIKLDKVQFLVVDEADRMLIWASLTIWLSEPAHGPAQTDHDVQRNVCPAHPATGHACDARWRRIGAKGDD